MKIITLIVSCLVLIDAMPQHGYREKGANDFQGAKMKIALTTAPLAKKPKSIGIDNFGTLAASAPDMYQGDIKLTPTQMKSIKVKRVRSD
jgi:hypothetical protein